MKHGLARKGISEHLLENGPGAQASLPAIQSAFSSSCVSFAHGIYYENRPGSAGIPACNPERVFIIVCELILVMFVEVERNGANRRLS